MKKAILANCLVFLCIWVNAQTPLRTALQATPSIPLYDKIEWVDLDGDQDLDLVTFYLNDYAPSQNHIKVFENKDLIFTEVVNAIDVVSVQPVNYDFADYDADGDIDFIFVDYQTLKIAVNQGNL